MSGKRIVRVFSTKLSSPPKKYFLSSVRSENMIGYPIGDVILYIQNQVMLSWVAFSEPTSKIILGQKHGLCAPMKRTGRSVL